MEPETITETAIIFSVQALNALAENAAQETAHP